MKTLQNFHKQVVQKESITIEYAKISLKFKKEDLIPLNLKQYAYMQLLDENIPSKNIEISNLCTYESDDDFHSWRRSRTHSRQWNFICP